MIILENEYEHGELVYLQSDDEDRKRVVTALVVCPNDTVMYQLSLGHIVSVHYAFEITRERIAC